MRAEYVNPFLESAVRVLSSVTGETPSRGKVELRRSPFPSHEVAVVLGITGRLEGQVIYSLPVRLATHLASRMVGFEVLGFDELARSAIAELGNMISGNATTIFSINGIPGLWISPPSVFTGKDMEVSVENLPTVVVPLRFGELGDMEINVALREKGEDPS